MPWKVATAMSLRDEFVKLAMRPGANIRALCRQFSISPKVGYKWLNRYKASSAAPAEKVLVDRPHQAGVDLLNEYNQLRVLVTELNEKNRLLKQMLELLGERIGRKTAWYSQAEKMAIIQMVQGSELSVSKTLKTLHVNRPVYYKWYRLYEADGYDGLAAKKPHASRKHKYEDEKYKKAVFSILHAPPKDHGFNRTSWRLVDLCDAMKARGLALGTDCISKIIKDAGYRFRSAKKVLTSTDPAYKTKLRKITGILSRLKSSEKFFSIDEYGPFAIKLQGGRSYVRPGRERVVPQFQKSKGSLILTGALELSTNQLTHFYSPKKDTGEMIKLLELLVADYADQERIFLSWDAASWHASALFKRRVREHNRRQMRPKVRLAPLPACAQFLNVIESVFSGMARAIIHNSDYQSVTECKTAIDRYLRERNQFYIDNPKRAGNKIWGSERVEPRFSESNNCKDPHYLHDFR